VIRTTSGDEVKYWRAVVCVGAVPTLPPVPGLAEHAVTMWSVEDAQELQRRIGEQFKLAAKMPSAEMRRAALSFTVCGGGATGVEIVGTMGQLLPLRAAEAGLNREDLNIHLVEGRPDILYDLDPSQREKARRRMSRMGIDVITGSMVSSVKDGAVVLEDGRLVPSPVLVWCGGASANPEVARWGFATDNAGRIIVDEHLKVAGLDDVYALGDVAAFRDPATKRTLPMLAQFAIRQGDHAAKNILCELEGRPTEPYHPHMHGEFVSVGPRWGIGWMLGLKLSGIPAIIMKRMTYIMYWWQVGGAKLAWSRTRELLQMQR
jgi:NADH dehydrogenase